MRTLTHSPADIVASVLVAKSLGVLIGTAGAWPISVSGEHSYPDDLITVFDTTGISHGSVMTGGPDDGELQGHYGFQIRVRSAVHKTGWTKADTIRATLAQNAINVTVTIESSTYLVENFANIGDVIVLGKQVQDSKTNLFTLNGVVSCRQTA